MHTMIHIEYLARSAVSCTRFSFQHIVVHTLLRRGRVHAVRAPSRSHDVATERATKNTHMHTAAPNPRSKSKVKLSLLLPDSAPTVRAHMIICSFARAARNENVRTHVVRTCHIVHDLQRCAVHTQAKCEREKTRVAKCHFSHRLVYVVGKHTSARVCVCVREFILIITHLRGWLGINCAASRMCMCVLDDNNPFKLNDGRASTRKTSIPSL